MTITLYRIGTDVEFLLVSNGRVLAMHEFLSVRDRILHSYIGTDAHAATGEIRPPASHNIQTLLYKIGFALSLIDDSLVKRYGNTRIFGSPYLLNEPLGGHIHVSFFSRQRSSDDAQVAATLSDGRSSADFVARILSYFIVPYEGWIQPWAARILRSHHYGHAGDVMRLGETGSPKELVPDELYHHYEYRLPSTWIIHPTIAYCYLALAKLAIINTKIIAPHLSTLFPHHFHDAEPRNHTMEALFFRNLSRHPSLRYTPDLRQLPAALEKSGRLRERLWSKLGECDIAAWRKLL